MNQKLPLDGRIYTLTVGRVLNTTVFQINLGELLFRATQSQGIGSCLSTWTVPKSMQISQLVYGRGSFMRASIHC